MEGYQALLDSFVQESRRILGRNLVGVYLHGSAAMGCFHEKTSDIDLIVVVEEAVPSEIKRRYMDMAVRLHEKAPAKGLEFSVVRRAVCAPFVYPTPFELHFSRTHLEWYRTAPEDYVEKMRGTDKDLAAHFTVLYHRGRVLYGAEIRRIFAPVSREDYLDSIWNDVKDAAEAVEADPVYMILNLCRVLAYQEEGLILSKEEGGEWGVRRVPEKFRALVLAAAAAYRTGTFPRQTRLREYAEYMLERIQREQV